VRGRGVDHPHVAVVDHPDRRARRLVGKAQHDDIGGVEHVGAAGGVLALGLGQRQELELRTPLEPGPDLEPGGARLAVDEDSRAHRLGSWWSQPDRALGLRNAP
jgi:hypothetical protein